MTNRNHVRALAVALAVGLVGSSTSVIAVEANAQEYVNRSADAVKHIQRGSTQAEPVSDIDDFFSVDAIDSGEVSRIAELTELDHIVHGRISDVDGYSSGEFIYFQWVDRDGQLSPLYTARSHALEGNEGYFAIAVPDWVDATGRIHRFNATREQQVQLDAYVPYRHQQRVLAGNQTTPYAFFAPGSREVNLQIADGGAFHNRSDALIAEFDSTQLPAQAGQTAHGLRWWQGNAQSLKDQAFNGEIIGYRWRNETTGRTVSSCVEERTVTESDGSQTLVELDDSERNRCTELKIPATAKRGDVYSFEVLANDTVVSHESFIVTGELNERDDFLFGSERLLGKQQRVVEFGRFRDGFNRAETVFAPRAVPGIDVSVDNGTIYVSPNNDLGNATPDVFDATVDVSFYNSGGSRPAKQPILLDTDRDGNADIYDPDDDGDGVLDTIEIADNSNKKDALSANIVISADLPEALQGQRYVARVEADNVPRDAQLELVSTIPGVSYNANAGVLEGTPTQTGTFPVTFRASSYTQAVTNGSGEPFEQTVGRLVVRPATTTVALTTTSQVTTTAPTPTETASVTTTRTTTHPATVTQEVSSPALTLRPTMAQIVTSTSTTTVTPAPTISEVTPAPSITTVTSTQTEFDRPVVRAGEQTSIEVPGTQVAPSANTPDWVSAQPDGRIDLAPPRDTPAGDYNVEVVTPDGRPAVVPVRVAPAPTSSERAVVRAGEQTSVKSAQTAPTQGEAFTPGKNTPEWVTVNPSGQIDFKPPRDVEPGEYKVEVVDPAGETSTVTVEVTAAVSDAERYTVRYDFALGRRGHEATSFAPLFDVTEGGYRYLNQIAPAGTTYEVVGGDATVDRHGRVTFAIPGDAAVGDVIETRIRVIFPDGSSVEVPAKFEVAEQTLADAASPRYLDGVKAGPGERVSVPQVGEADAAEFYLKPGQDLKGWEVIVDPLTGEVHTTAPATDAQALDVEVMAVFSDGSRKPVKLRVDVGEAAAAETEPAFAEQVAGPGETVRIPQTKTMPEGTFFDIADDGGLEAAIDPVTGELTVRLPDDAPADATYVIGVKTTYPDGTVEIVPVKIGTDSIGRAAAVKYPSASSDQTSGTVTATPTGVPDGSTFALDPAFKDADWVVSVNKNTGEITATLRTGIVGERSTVVPVRVTFPDGSVRAVPVEITAKRVAEQPAADARSARSSEGPWWIIVLVALLGVLGIGWAATEYQDQIRHYIPQFPVLPRL